jgi:hypothetical protein
MKKKNKCYCDFHFIIDEELKRQLLDRQIFKDTAGFSGTIVKILQLMYPRIEKEHFFGNERFSCYQFVTPDLTVDRQNVHVYLPLDLYRRLKLIHQDLNFYSIAQFLRWMLQLFLHLRSSHGSNLKQKLAALLALWRKQNAVVDLPQEIVRQLFKFRSRKPGKPRLVNIYNPGFSPLAVLRC